jgi:hypothetical protein
MFTNIVVTNGPLSTEPPESAWGVLKSARSTLIIWPWLQNVEEQASWISGTQIEMFGLGFLDCGSGFQFVVRKNHIAPMISILEACQ